MIQNQYQLVFKKLSSVFAALAFSVFIVSCNGSAQGNSSDDTSNDPDDPNTGGTMQVETLAEGLEHPWGMTFLPDGRLLVTERAGSIRILNTNNELSEPLSGLPEIHVQGQGGALDLALDPDYEQNQWIYFSYAEPGANNTSSTAVGRGKLSGNSFTNFEVLFSQEPKYNSGHHFGGRIAFSQDGKLFLTMGDRGQKTPAQDLSNHVGTVIRINKDGSIPADNPFVNETNAADEIFSYGHRNIEAAAINPANGNLYVVEMGPQGGDEFNYAQAGQNYGWPEVSWGENYDGTPIPDHDTEPQFEAPLIHWTPVISPSGMIFYTGDMFPEWQNTAMIGGLTAQGIVRVNVNANNAEEVERISLEARIRDVEQAPDGSVYVLTDESNGKVLRLKK